MGDLKWLNSSLVNTKFVVKKFGLDLGVFEGVKTEYRISFAELALFF